MAPRKRKNEADAWMPPRVYPGKSAYEWRPKGGGCVRLCGLESKRSEVWAAYEEAVAGYDRDTLKHLVELYLASPHFKGLAKNTQADYRNCSAKVLEVFGQMRPDTITAPHVRKYMDIRGEHSPTRANRERSFIRAVYAWGYERGHVTKNPTDGVRTFKEPPRDRYVTDDEYQAVYELANPAIQVAMEIAYLCAAREGDVLKLEFGRNGQTEPLPGQTAVVLDKGIYIAQGKTGKRQVKLWTPRLRKAVDRARKLHTRRKLPVVSRWVVHNKQGQPYTKDGFKALWRKAMLKWLGEDARSSSNPKWFTFHDLKAKAITDYRGDKQRFSGNASKRTMERVYNRLPDEVESHDPDGDEEKF